MKTIIWNVVLAIFNGFAVLYTLLTLDSLLDTKIYSRLPNIVMSLLFGQFAWFTLYALPIAALLMLFQKERWKKVIGVIYLLSTGCLTFLLLEALV